MAKKKHPELEKMRDELLAHKALIEEKSAPLRAERKAIKDKITPDLDKLRELDKAIHDAEQPHLRDINNQLVALTKALGPVKA